MVTPLTTMPFENYQNLADQFDDALRFLNQIVENHTNELKKMNKPPNICPNLRQLMESMLSNGNYYISMFEVVHLKRCICDIYLIASQIRLVQRNGQTIVWAP